MDDNGSEDYWTNERIELSALYQYYVYLLAYKLAKKNNYLSVLDIGCGPGTKADRILSRHFSDIILIDQPNCYSLVKKTLPNAEFIGTDLEHCSIKLKNKVDMIVCADVLEHLHNPFNCLKFAYENLKPSGLALFSTPERDFLRGSDCMTSPHPTHVREWNADEFQKFLDYSGFRVIKQIMLPVKKLQLIEEMFRIAFCSFINLPKWSSCQVAVCCLKKC